MKRSPDPSMSDEQWCRLRKAMEVLDMDGAGVDVQTVEPKVGAFTLPVPHIDPEWRRRQVVYLIACAGYVKIGTSQDVQNRFRGLLGSTPFDLDLIAIFEGGQKLERELQKHFRAHHHRDEWFRIEGAFAEWIAELRAEGRADP